MFLLLLNLSDLQLLQKYNLLCLIWWQSDFKLLSYSGDCCQQTDSPSWFSAACCLGPRGLQRLQRLAAGPRTLGQKSGECGPRLAVSNTKLRNFFVPLSVLIVEAFSPPALLRSLRTSAEAGFSPYMEISGGASPLVTTGALGTRSQGDRGPGAASRDGAPTTKLRSAKRSVIFLKRVSCSWSNIDQNSSQLFLVTNLSGNIFLTASAGLGKFPQIVQYLKRKENTIFPS